MIKRIRYARAVIVQLNTGNILDFGSGEALLSDTLDSGEGRADALDGTTVPVERRRTLSLRPGSTEVVEFARIMAESGCPCRAYLLSYQGESQMALHEPARLSVVDDSRGLGTGTTTLQLETHIFRARISEGPNLWEGLPWESAFVQVADVGEVGDYRSVSDVDVGGASVNRRPVAVSPGPSNGSIFWLDRAIFNDLNPALRGSTIDDVGLPESATAQSMAYDRINDDLYVINDIGELVEIDYVAGTLNNLGGITGEAIAIAHDETVWTADLDASSTTLYRWSDIQSATTDPPDSYTVGATAQAIGVDKEGRVWLFEVDGASIYTLDEGTLSLDEAQPLNATLEPIKDAAISSEGAIAVPGEDQPEVYLLYHYRFSTEASASALPVPDVLASGDGNGPSITGRFPGAARWRAIAPIAGAELSTNVSTVVRDVDEQIVAESDNGRISVYPLLGWAVDVEDQGFDSSPELTVDSPGQPFGVRRGAFQRDCSVTERPQWMPVEPLTFEVTADGIGEGETIQLSTYLEQDDYDPLQGIDRIEVATSSGFIVASESGPEIDVELDPVFDQATSYTVRIFAADTAVLDRLSRWVILAEGRASFGRTNFDLISETAMVNCVNDSAPRVTSMTIVVDTSKGSSDLQDIAIPLRDDTAYDLEVLWNPGTSPSFAETTRVDGQLDPAVIEGVELTPFRPVQHTYDDVYRGQIKIAGRMPRWAYANQPDAIDGTAVSRKDALIAVERWADLEWSNFREAFFGCSELITTGAGVFFDEGAQQWFADQLIEGYRPAPVGALRGSFRDCTSYGPTDSACDIADWAYGEVTSFRSFLQGASVFDVPMTELSTSGALTSVESMLRDATSFNQSLSFDDTSQVQNFQSMFEAADSFNNGEAAGATGTFFLDAGSGRSSADVSLARMFNGANAFNQNINSWLVSNIASVGGGTGGDGMFHSNTSFQNGAQALEWELVNCSVFRGMFMRALFNQPVPNLVTSAATDVENMFRENVQFDQDISGWNLSNVRNANLMFFNASSFNNQIGNAPLTLEQARLMFNGASAFDQDISGWDVSQVDNFDVGGGTFAGGAGFTGVTVNSIMNAWEAGLITAPQPERISWPASADGEIDQTVLDNLAAEGIEVYAGGVLQN